MAEKKAKIIKPQEGFQERFVRTNVDFCVAGGVLNCGKAQPMHSLVLTPKGFVEMGSLVEGQEISDTKGGTQFIEHIYERGVLDNYKVYFDDGSFVECCDEHLWTVYDSKEKKDVTIELKEISKDIDRYKVRLTSAVYYPKKQLKIEPYLLGLLLGDACLSTCEHSSIYLTTDKECVETAYNINKFDYVWHTYDNKYPYATITEKKIRESLREYGLLGKKSNEKFIPKEYLLSSVEDRKNLLRGLFDTDGYNDTRSYRVEYSTSSKQLASDVSELVRSLGGKVSISTKVGKYKDKNGNYVNCKTSYRLSCRISNKNEYFLLSRKKNDKEQFREIYLKFSKIEYNGKEKMRCLWVSNPNHLYITNNFVVTHNSFAAVLSVAEPSLDSRFRGLFLRNNLADARASGGLLDTFKEAYGEGCEVVESGDPRVTFPSGARIDVTHVADQSRDKVLQRFKGRQYDFIYFDEGTGFTWDCFTAIYSRNRGTASWTGKVRMTTNPDRRHWLRKFLDWYIGVDGFIREDRDGVVRYFYMNGEKVDDVVWGDSKEEVYQKCKIQIDRVLRKVNGKTGTATYKDMVKSFTFYLGRMSENKASIGNNSGYVGSVAVTGGRNAQQLLEGNWNVSPEEDLDAPITSEMANQVFVNDPRENGDRWVTCDLADTGTDNFLCLAWNGFNIIDCLILGHTTPRQNAERLEMFAAQHDVSNSHIIYDAVRGTYINDYIPEAIPFVSYRTPVGIYGRMAYHLKDECYMRLVEFIKRGDLTMEDRVSQRVYEHQRLKENITIQNEFIEECSVVRFKDMPSGKKTLYSKKEMNANLGKGRSMDLLDPCAMRMLPVLEYPYGEEIEKTMNLDSEEDDNSYDGVDIYNDSTWC